MKIEVGKCWSPAFIPEGNQNRTTHIGRRPSFPQPIHGIKQDGRHNEIFPNNRTR